MKANTRYNDTMSVTDTIRTHLLASTEDLIIITARTGVPTSVLSRLANGRTVPSGTTIDALADYYGLTLQPARKPSGKATTNTTATTTSTTKRSTRKGN
jgi:hypothetical protein